MTLTIICDGGTRATVSETEAPELLETFDIWQAAFPRSLHEVARWDAVIDAAERYMQDNGCPELVIDVCFA